MLVDFKIVFYNNNVQKIHLIGPTTKKNDFRISEFDGKNEKAFS